MRRRRRAARRWAWRSFSRLEMKCRRRRASCSTPSRWTSLLKRRTSCSESSPSRRVTCSTYVLSHRSATSRRYARLHTKPAAHNPSTDGASGTIPADAARGPRRKKRTGGASPKAERYPKRFVLRTSGRPSTSLRIDTHPHRSAGPVTAGAPDSGALADSTPPLKTFRSVRHFSALAGSGHRTGQSLQIVARRYPGCSRRFHDCSKRLKRGVPSSPPEPLALPELPSDENTAVRRSHRKH